MDIAPIRNNCVAPEVTPTLVRSVETIDLSTVQRIEEWSRRCTMASFVLALICLVAFREFGASYLWLAAIFAAITLVFTPFVAIPILAGTSTASTLYTLTEGSVSGLTNGGAALSIEYIFLLAFWLLAAFATLILGVLRIKHARLLNEISKARAVVNSSIAPSRNLIQLNDEEKAEIWRGALWKSILFWPFTFLFSILFGAQIGVGSFARDYYGRRLGNERLRTKAQLSAISAEGLLAEDRRAPIPFLRSFKYDGVAIESDEGKKLTIEEALGERVAHLGPFIAVGRPGETLPELGAARTYKSDDQWKSAVLDWLNRSQLIVVLVGGSNALQWEIEQIITNGHSNKTIYFIPKWDARGAIESLRHQLSSIDPGFDFQHSGEIPLIAVHFSLTRIILITGSSNGQQMEYQTAFDLLVSRGCLLK